MTIDKINIVHKAKKILIIFCVFACAFFLLLPLLSIPNTEQTPSPISLAENWTIMVDDKFEKENVTLPYQLSHKTGTIIDLYNTVPKTDFYIDAISFPVFQKNVWVYVDDVLIYKHIFKPSLFNATVPGSGTVFVTLPQDSEGKELHLQFEKLVSFDTDPFPSVDITSGAATSLKQPGDSFVLALMFSLAVIGILLVIMSTVFRKIGFASLPLISLALIVLSTSLWTLCNSKIIEFFIQNWNFVHNVEYISFYLIPLSLWMFIKYNWKNPSKIASIFSNIMFLFFALSLLLKFFFQVDFYVLLRVFHVLVLSNVPFFIMEIVQNYKKRPESFKIFSFSLIVLVLSAVIDFVRYYTVFTPRSVASIFIWGIAVWSVFLLICFVLSTKERLDFSFGLVTKNNLDIEHRRYDILLKNTKDIFMDWDLSDDSVQFSEAFSSYFGHLPFKTNFPDNVKKTQTYITYTRSLDEIHQCILNGSPGEQLIGTFLNSENKKQWFDIDITTIFDKDQKPVRVVGILKDITQSKKLEEEFAYQNQYLQINRELYDNVLEADITNNMIIGENYFALAELLGLGHNVCYNDIILAIAAQLTHEDYKESYVEMLSRERILSLYENQTSLFTFECIEKTDGINYQWIRLTVRIFKSDITNTIHIISYVKNIDAEKKREFDLVNTSQIDSLSGLYNKGATKNHIDDFLESKQPENVQHAFLMIDIDYFKRINDTLGHAMGDLAITQISKKLQEHFRESDIIGRIGGDEFAVLMKNTGSTALIQEKCQDLCNEFHYPFSQNGKICEISISIGICIFPQQGSTYDLLYKNADIALYSSKRSGRNTFSFFSGNALS